MTLFFETIKTLNNDQKVAAVTTYGDELTAAQFFHMNMMNSISAIRNGEMKAIYANIHTESGVILQQERRVMPEPAPTPEGE